MSEQPKKKSTYIVSIDQGKCINAGRCVTVAPRAFAIEDDVAIVTDPGAEDDETLLEAAEVCPTLAIYLDTPDGRPIYPPV